MINFKSVLVMKNLSTFCCFSIIAIILMTVETSVCNLSDNTIEKITETTKTPIVRQKELQLLDTLKKQIRAKEEELKKAEAINKNFEKMIQLVSVLGQIDTFLTERSRALIRKMAILAEDDDEVAEENFER